MLPASLPTIDTTSIDTLSYFGKVLGWHLFHVVPSYLICSVLLIVIFIVYAARVFGFGLITDVKIGGKALVDVVELYVFGTTFKLSIKAIHESFALRTEDGKFVGGLMLFLVTVLGVTRVFYSTRKPTIKSVINVLSASYGTDINEIDVLPNVNTMLSNGASFIVGNNLFGDPSPGEAKRLRLRYTAPDNTIIVRDFLEGSVFGLS